MEENNSMTLLVKAAVLELAVRAKCEHMQRGFRYLEAILEAKSSALVAPGSAGGHRAGCRTESNH